ncbi:MAG: DUF2332 family protein [Polyangiales bacterium]
MRPSQPPPSSTPTPSGADALGEDLARQRALIGDTNPIYARLLTELEGILSGANPAPAIVDRLDRAWRERRFTAYFERPLILLASLRTDAVMTGPKHPLARALANDDAPDPDAITRPALLEAMHPDRLAFWLTVATRRIQTNEVSRAVAWRWPAHLAGCGDGKRPLALVDVGASGGLNLIADRLEHHWVDGRGAPLPVVEAPNVVARVGFDQAPLDFVQGDDAAWARACIWPGENERLRRFDEAVAALRAASDQVKLQRLNATLVPTRLVDIFRSLPEDTLLLVYQTLVRAYMDPDRRDAYVRGMRSFVAQAPRTRVAWIELEIDDFGPPPASIHAHVPDGAGSVHTFVLGRCSYHPHEIDVRAGAGAFIRAMQ